MKSNHFIINWLKKYMEKTKFIIDVNYNYIYKINEIIIYIFCNIYEYI